MAKLNIGANYKMVTYSAIANYFADDGTLKSKLDYLGSVTANPRLRLDLQIPQYTPLIVTEEYKYSPDIISFDAYGTEFLHWFVCRYNGIVNPLDPKIGIVPGRLLKIADAQSTLKWLQSLTITNNTNNGAQFVKV